MMNLLGIQEMKNVFKAAVESVKPSKLIGSQIKCVNNTVHIGEEIKIQVNQNCHVIGFGKAVLSMSTQLHSILSDHIKQGVISIPHDVVSQYNLSSTFLEKFKIYEGAVNNIPDSDSLRCSNEILDVVSQLSPSDILFVLISGGGSALLTCPVEGLTLEDKQKTIQLLSKSGATIQELNSVRKRLSRVKGGKLAQLSQAKTISLVLSDVIGDPLTVIASGPTVPNSDPDGRAWEIIQHYRLEDRVPTAVKDILDIPTLSNIRHDPLVEQNVHNLLIGNNLRALESAANEAVEQGFVTVILSDRIQGDAKTLGLQFANLEQIIARMMTDTSSLLMQELSVVAAEHLQMDPKRCCQLERIIRRCARDRKNLMIIGGGESTVAVVGSGRGGRNQEMALSWAVQAASFESLPPDLQVNFMSAGTDGIDGPTDAAGAFSHPKLVEEGNKEGLDAVSYLNNNDSYSFFRQLSGGAYHLLTGPTGTNVMDIHMLSLSWKQSETKVPL